MGSDHVVVESFGNGARAIFDKVEHVQIVACGTSYNSGMVARYWFEEIAGVSCDVEIASEFRYRKSVVRPNSLLGLFPRAEKPPIPWQPCVWPRNPVT